MKISDLGYLGGGILIGFGAAWLALEDHFGEKYAEMANANKRAYELAKSGLPVEDPHQMELDFNEVAVSPGLQVVKDMSVISASVVNAEDTPAGETLKVTPLKEEPAKNIYHKAIEAAETDSDMFVAGGINDYGVSYIEESEFMEEDGRAKFRVDLIMDESNPLFLLDGVQIEDWDTRLGDSILVDFYKHCPPGTEPILYVRNHRTDEDYEVVRVEP